MFERLDKRTDIIILSDHGMLTLTPKNFIDLYDFVDRSVKMYGTSPVLQVVARVPTQQLEVCNELIYAAQSKGNFNAYTMDTLPKRWRVNNPQRFGPCVVVAEPGWAFQDMFDYASWFYEHHNISSEFDVYSYFMALFTIVERFQ